jgi:2,3-dihydroxybenzoate decarboxylase
LPHHAQKLPLATEPEPADTLTGAIHVSLSADIYRYLDHDAYEPLWAAVEELGVPVYLHPREPLPAQQETYEGYESLTGSAWSFAHETATHAVRPVRPSPGVQIILGHLAEGLPFLLPRLELRLPQTIPAQD